MKETSDVNLHMHLLEMEITNKCNLNCKHCYNRGETKEDMPLDEVKKLLAFANKHKVGKVIISGGEACMSSHAKEIFAYIAKQRKSLQNIQKVVVQSNGSIERFLDTYDFSGIDLVHLSFDIDENGIRKIDKNHTIALAKKIEEKGIGAYLFTTVHKQNIDYIDEIVQCANQAGIPIAFNVCLDTGKDGEVLLSKEQKVQAYEKLLQYEKEGKIRPVKHPHIAVIRGQKEASSKIRGGCTAGIASCSVLSNGDVIPCPFLRIRVGNIREKSLEEIWLTSPLLAELRNREKYEGCGNCAYVSFCGGCRSSAYRTSGSLSGYDTACLKEEALAVAK